MFLQSKSQKNKKKGVHSLMKRLMIVCDPIQSLHVMVN